MTATAQKYLPRFYSEVLREVGSPDDCGICAGLVLYDAATMGEGVLRDDGSEMNAIALRELRDEAGLRPDGPLRLPDVAQFLAFVSKRAGMDPPFRMEWYTGQPPGTLRLTWDELVDRLRRGHVAILNGNPIGVKDPGSPLRALQRNDDYAHSIAVMDGRQDEARVFDALHPRGDGFRGEFVPWTHLRQFTEARKGGDRQFGTPASVACAVARIGQDTAAARTERRLKEEAAERVQAVRAQLALAREERDQARRDLATARKQAAAQDARADAAEARAAGLEAELAACLARPAADCSAVQAQLEEALAAFEVAEAERVAERDAAREERDAALTRITRAVEVLAA